MVTLKLIEKLAWHFDGFLKFVSRGHLRFSKDWGIWYGMAEDDWVMGRVGFNKVPCTLKVYSYVGEAIPENRYEVPCNESFHPHKSYLGGRVWHYGG